MIGYIHTVEREEYNIVTVDFHDRSSHVSMRFDDSIKYNMAALGMSLIALRHARERSSLTLFSI
jgi:chromosome transmission fidelity protein 4